MTPVSEPIVELKGVDKVYETRLVRTTAVRNADFAVREREFLSVSGPSGSGKSTLLSVAGLLLPATSGRVSYFGSTVSALDTVERARLRNRHIGFVFQTFNLIAELTVLDNVILPTTFAHRRIPEAADRAMDILERFGLADRSRHYPAELSGGQQQRAAIARALIMGPSIVFADEPTGNLDSASAQRIIGLLLDVNARGTALVVVSHNDEVARLANRHYSMFDGHLANSTTTRPSGRPDSASPMAVRPST